MLGFTPFSSAPLSSPGGAIVFDSASILGRAIVTATAGALEASASISARANVSCGSAVTYSSSPSITSIGRSRALGYVLKPTSASIIGSATVTSDSFIQQEQQILINAVSTVIADSDVSHFASANTNVYARVSAIGYIIGEEWTKQVAGSDIWLKQG